PNSKGGLNVSSKGDVGDSGNHCELALQLVSHVRHQFLPWKTLALKGHVKNWLILGIGLGDVNLGDLSRKPRSDLRQLCLDILHGQFNVSVHMKFKDDGPFTIF